MAEYKLIPGGVFHNPTGAWIPDDPNNTHWGKYLKWEGVGNIPDPVDPEPQQEPRNHDVLEKILIDKGVATRAEIDAARAQLKTGMNQGG